MSGKDPGIRFPPPLVFLGFGLIGWSVERLAGFGAVPIPEWFHWAAAFALGAAGLLLLASALQRFWKAGTSPEPWKSTLAIADDGIYGFTRNPMYLGMALLQAAAAAGLASAGILLALLPAVLVIDRFVVRREEAYLQRRFGASYADYLSLVPRWLGR